jgi:hypothetical protein
MPYWAWYAVRLKDIGLDNLPNLYLLGLNMVPNLGMLVIEANHAHLSMGYHHAFRPYK